MNGNTFFKIILRSPLHRLFSENYMLITVTGRKSGRLITLPVNYYQEGNTLWILSSRERSWPRNLFGGAEVTLSLRGHEVKARAEAVLDEAAVASEIEEYVRHLPMSAKPLGLRIENNCPNWEDLSRLAKCKLFIKLRITNN